jgi:serine protease Do
MNSPILWWTARYARPLQFTRNHPNLFSRLARGLLAASMVATMAPAYADNAPAASSAPQVKVDSSELPRSTGAITSFAPVVDKVGPSIVTVYTTRDAKPQSNPLAGNPTLRRFFGIPDDPDDEGGESGRMMGLGSGVIVSADGLILTNNHVAEAGDDIKVRIGEHGHEYKAKVVGNDPSSDLALLRIDAKDLPVITFADSDQVKVGDLALAVGSPFGLTNTVTMGIVSALGRGGMGITDYEDFIQTDASINPGNSGGALVDIQGRLIGINTAIYSRSGGNQGIGFAVPSNLARTVMDSLIKNGKVVRGYLGTVVQPLTPDLAEQFKVPDDQQGALIAEVASGGAAEKAGLKSGDIVTGVNGKPVTDPHSLRLVVGGMNPGDKVSVAFLRDGQAKTMDVVLGTQAPQGDIAAGTPQQDEHPNVLDGVTVGDLDDPARTELKAPKEVKGVLVTDVDQNSVGYDAGLRKGDVILEMNHQPLTSADEAVTEGNKIEKTERVLLHVWSKGNTEFLVLKPRA